MGLPCSRLLLTTAGATGWPARPHPLLHPPTQRRLPQRKLPHTVPSWQVAVDIVVTDADLPVPGCPGHPCLSHSGACVDHSLPAGCQSPLQGGPASPSPSAAPHEPSLTMLRPYPRLCCWGSSPVVFGAKSPTPPSNFCGLVGLFFALTTFVVSRRAAI